MKKLLVLMMALMLVVSAVACAPAQEPAAPSTDAAPIKVGRADVAPHGGGSFAVVFAVMQGDKVAAVSLDEYQFMPKDQITAGVPNSDNVGERGFALNFKDENVVLASKRINSEYYSANMKERGGSTQDIITNFDAIEAFCIGKTIAEIEQVANEGEKAVDAVSGATLADTAGYLAAILEAAKAAK